MYYEEKTINGVLCARTSPKGGFFPLSPEELSQKITRLLEEIEWLREAQGEPTIKEYVQLVPDKCDRITWRGRYYRLPLDTAPPLGSGDRLRFEIAKALYDKEERPPGPDDPPFGLYMTWEKPYFDKADAVLNAANQEKG